MAAPDLSNSNTYDGTVLPNGIQRAQVHRVHHWSLRQFSLTISRPPTFRFRSGEFVMIGLPIAGRPLMRAYSIASPIYADELEFLSIKVPGGALTSHLQKVKRDDWILLGHKPTGSLLIDALQPGRRLFLLATGTGLAPFLSIIRDPDIYSKFEEVTLVHSVRYVYDLAHRYMLTSKLSDDCLVKDQAGIKFKYLPTVTREEFPRRARITQMIEPEPPTQEATFALDPKLDRVMLCGGLAMIRECRSILERLGFCEGSMSEPAHYVVERAFAGQG